MADGGRLASVVLVSGGVDSAVCLALAASHGRTPLALTFDYGQRNRPELDRAAELARFYDCRQLVVPLDLAAWGGSALTGGAAPGGPPLTHGDRQVYVPARNLIFLSVAVGVAEAHGLDLVYIGSGASDHAFPDSSSAFLAAFQAAADVGLGRAVHDGRPVRIRAPLLAADKVEVVELAVRMGVPLELTWSCYRDAAVPCGACLACGQRAEAFAAAAIVDPATGHAAGESQ
jgi:7-cyano-7-deazaguanine synthase